LLASKGEFGYFARIILGNSGGESKVLIKYAFVGLMCALLATACGSRRPKLTPDEDYLPSLTNFSEDSERITIMTWNMENLFDAEDSQKNGDDTFLPLSIKQQLPYHKEKCEKSGAFTWIQQCLNWDWNEDVIQLKLQRLAEVIKSVDHGEGPDILVVQEVENFAILNRLTVEHLAGMGYTTYLLENDDYRGIDVGVITRLKPIEDPYLKELRSRPGFFMKFRLNDGSLLNLVGVHLPISPTPVAKRVEMIKTMATFAAQRPNEFTIAAGDFNFPFSLEREYDILNTHVKPDWVVSHLYCKSCNGTFYDNYEESWSQLDYILLSKNFLNQKTRWTLDPKSVHIHNMLPIQMAYDGAPADFGLPSMSGVSDHWPLVIQLVKTDPFSF